MSNWCCEIPEEEVKMAVDQMGLIKHQALIDGFSMASLLGYNSN